MKHLLCVRHCATGVLSHLLLDRIWEGSVVRFTGGDGGRERGTACGGAGIHRRNAFLTWEPEAEAICLQAALVKPHSVASIFLLWTERTSSDDSKRKTVTVPQDGPILFEKTCHVILPGK